MLTSFSTLTQGIAAAASLRRQPAPIPVSGASVSIRQDPPVSRLPSTSPSRPHQFENP
jgi:hypothetical protein